MCLFVNESKSSVVVQPKYHVFCGDEKQQIVRCTTKHGDYFVLQGFLSPPLFDQDGLGVLPETQEMLSSGGVSETSGSAFGCMQIYTWMH